ncbi:anti-sigma factor family protein [Lihuaxuella thermophila]|uniref:Putative zinc-finger n=1 Tax=Lihuaxuella thermophila TaxID=1173111 RepID=A0A1H8D8N2_9BACL|nr:zf-HC2 domain-containing protein [Lihuaxuella thermophila]SEN03582.1 Putative zinc-finger [Lihuaxuella thermophila]
MGSEKIMELIQRDLDDDLSPAEKEALEAHLSQRPEDRKLAQQLRSLSNELSRLPKVVPPSSVIDSILPAIDEDLAQAADKQQKRIRSRWVKTGAAVAIAAVAALFTLPFLPLEQGSQPSTSTYMETSVKKEGSSAADPRQRSSEDGTFMTTFESQGAVWSPDQVYQAKWEEERLIVRKPSGEIQYRSERFKGERLIALTWKSNREIEAVLSGKDGQEMTRKVTIDVVQKKRTK